MNQLQNIPIIQIEVGPNRKRAEEPDEEIAELAASIKRVGILEPIIVGRKNDMFVLISGHRRIKAAKEAGLGEIPALIKEANEAEVSEISFAENIFRRDLSPVELAAAIRGCLESGTMNIEQLAVGLHRTQKWVIDQAEMTTWAPEVLQAIHNKAISVSAAKNLAEITDPQYRAFLLGSAVQNGATARVTAAWKQGWQLSRPAEEAIKQEPVDGVVPAAAVVPQAPCLFCAQVFRTDGLNYMGVCPVCLADFQQARAQRMVEERGT